MPAVVHESQDPVAGDLLLRGAAPADWSASTAHRLRGRSPVDVRMSGGRICAVAPELAPLGHEEVLDVPGAVVVPGLHDHHLHLRSLVAAGRSVAVDPDAVVGLDGLARALREAPADAHGWRRAVGYHESVAGPLDRWSLDALVADAPVRVQHRSGIMWTLNSAGVDRLGLEADTAAGIERDGGGIPTGRLLRMDDWLACRLPDVDPLRAASGVSAQLAARGVTGLTDATPEADAGSLSAFADALAEGRLRQRVHLMCPFEVVAPDHPLVTRGPHKVMLDDDRLPALAELVDLVRRAHEQRVPVAVHCVTAAQLAFTAAGFAEAGTLAGDRIEHASLVFPDLAGRLAELGVTVVTNPGLVHARGDSYLDEVDEGDLDHLYPCASLRRTGVAVAAGTDAPFGPADPWTAVRAACTRLTRAGRVLGADEGLSVGAAVGLFGGRADQPGRPRRIAPGEPGDLCVLSGGAVPGPDGPGSVLATIVAGRVVHP